MSSIEFSENESHQIWIESFDLSISESSNYSSNKSSKSINSWNRSFKKSKIKKLDSAEVRKVKLLLLDLTFVYFLAQLD